MDFWYSVSKGICLAYTRILVKGYQVYGGENLVPGPKIIVANHPNASDAFYLPFIIEEKLHFFFQESLLKVPIIGPLLKRSDQIPVSAGRRKEAISKACKKLSQGNVVVIFPEGTLSHGNDIYRGKTGAANLVLESGVPIIPVGFYVPNENARMIQNKRNGGNRAGRWQFGGRCIIQIGEPWDLDLALYPNRSHQDMRNITEEMMTRIQNLVRMAEESVNK